MDSSIVPDGFDEIRFQNGRLVADFIEEQTPIGYGGFGVVTKAKHRINQKEYAIKKTIIKGKKY